jgi:hypothetical protein
VSPYRAAMETMLAEWDRLDAAQTGSAGPASYALAQNSHKRELLRTARLAALGTHGNTLTSFHHLAGAQ